jgi:translation initiation factor 2B subunit (eIF-2B alpha/beta/delta family)
VENWKKAYDALSRVRGAWCKAKTTPKNSKKESAIKPSNSEQIMSVTHKLLEVLQDRSHGSLHIAKNALRLAKLALERGENPRHVFSLFKKRSEMAILVNLERLASKALSKERDVTHIVDRLILELSKSELEFLNNARSFFKDSRVLTMSDSEQLRALFYEVEFERVYVLKSEPGGEGENLHHHLSQKGVSATLLPDLALFHALRKCDCAIVGSDSVTPRFFVNKLGTRTLAELATLLKKPLYVCTLSWKALPRVTKKRLFESVPNSRCAAFVSDTGVHKKDVYEKLRQRLSEVELALFKP